jgi:NADPH:quinone reductase-like Zn-dependent oxidoreductase
VADLDRGRSAFFTEDAVMTGYGPPDVLSWAAAPLAEPGEEQIRIKVKAAGISPTDLALRAGYLKDAIPLPPDAVLGFEAAGTVDAVGPGVTGASAGDGVTALLFSLGGYAEYAVASIWARKPDTVSVRYGPGLAGRVRALGAVDAVFDAAGKGVLADAIALADGPERSAGRRPARLRAHKTMPMRQAAEAHRQLESGNVHERIILTLE